MAVKTFGVGETLTSSDTNTYLANAGLVYITSQTVGSAVSSVTVSNCFSSTYDSYRILLTGIVASTDSPNCQFQLSGITSAVYYSAGNYYAWANTTINNYSPAAAAFWVVGTIGTIGCGIQFDIHNPNLAKAKFGYSQSAEKSYALQVGGYINSTLTATGFTLSTASGTWTGGTIRVYGYRQA